MTRRARFWHAMVLIVSSAAWSGQGIAQDDLPLTTNDGLERVDSPFTALFLRPGATLDQYRRVSILDCLVQFRDGWQSNQNRGKRSFNEVTAEDMARIKDAVAAEFLEVVTEVLEEDDAYEIVGGAAADVVLLRPAVINLDIGSDIFGSGSLLEDVTNGVSMTLYLEFFDSATSALIGRAFDPRVQPGNDRATVRRIFRRWAGDIRDTLDGSNGN